MSLLSDGLQCLLSLVSGNPETRRVVTSQFSDAHSRFPLSTLEAEESGSAGGTHSEMRLLRVCEAIFPFSSSLRSLFWTLYPSLRKAQKETMAPEKREGKSQVSALPSQFVVEGVFCMVLVFLPD